MKKLLILLLVLAIGSTGFSQRIYFMYLQTESEQPFFVKINEKIQSSTSSGYLILSRLKDSTYQFSVGFPGNQWPEQRFTININRKDHGYLLKYFEGKGWGLFDLQNLSVTMASVPNHGHSTVAVENKDVSRFTDILSKAADDPTLKEKPVPVSLDEKKTEVVVQPATKKEEAKPVVIDVAEAKKETGQPIVNDKIEKDVQTEVKMPQKTEVKPEEKTEEVRTEQPAYKLTTITKLFEKSGEEGQSISFVDQDENNRDTIHILIPSPKRQEVVKNETTQEKRFLDITTQPMEKTLPEKKEEEKKTDQVAVKPLMKNSCPGIATESDFFKLRKKMAGETSDYDMVDEARKVFKTKCFTVIQVKNLSSLFLTDLGKYMFFDAFYPYVSDPDNYPTLQAELKDTYYLNRFQAMLKN